ncbi:ArsI/CadI family heavy metal resistance metalloenzyme [Egicoccus sp. AB-alg2]|uniref:ArsI/CadI family heavy metal resistance metalloenzyme n=1 Tax=Egicoccus sp. AB-alg2 TaxID=3242693 RepID=UPI00359E5DF8
MSRVQLALDVTDLDAAVDFYSALLGVSPAKRKPGYANFAVEDPPLKLVLFEGERGGTLNHLGIEVTDSDEVASATARLDAAGLATDERRSETCCYATQDKVWVADPDGARWEVYNVLGDTPTFFAEGEGPDGATAAACCN